MTWPNDADVDVFSRLESDGFDFSKTRTVDYYVDFDVWPAPRSALELLQSRYGRIEVIEPEVDSDGYILFHVVGLVTYEEVTFVQRNTCLAMRPYSGICEAWGVMH